MELAHEVCLPELNDPIKAMLDALKLDFLDALPAKCDDIEALVLQCDGQHRHSLAFEELYRLIHSLKGAGGTHGLPLISAICHHFEDVLSHPELTLDTAVTNHALALTDAIRQVASLGRLSEPHALQGVAQHYEALKQRYDADITSVLVLESSKTMTLLLQRLLGEYRTRVTVVQDGLLALQRLLHEPFDLLIVAAELQHLTGQALIAALQLNQGVNARTPVILLTSKADSHAYPLKAVTVLPRTPDLPQLLSPIVAKLCQAPLGQ